MFKYYNPNPHGARVGDCTVRAISKALNQTWEQTYIDLCIEGLHCADMPSANHTWGRYLEQSGFIQEIASENTVKDFARNHSHGVYVVALSGHVVAVIDGVIYDTWDSSDETPIYDWRFLK